MEENERLRDYEIMWLWMRLCDYEWDYDRKNDSIIIKWFKKRWKKAIVKNKFQLLKKKQIKKNEIPKKQCIITCINQMVWDGYVISFKYSRVVKFWMS